MPSSVRPTIRQNALTQPHATFAAISLPRWLFAGALVFSGEWLRLPVSPSVQSPLNSAPRCLYSSGFDRRTVLYSSRRIAVQLGASPLRLDGQGSLVGLKTRTRKFLPRRAAKGHSSDRIKRSIANRAGKQKAQPRDGESSRFFPSLRPQTSSKAKASSNVVLVCLCRTTYYPSLCGRWAKSAAPKLCSYQTFPSCARVANVRTR